MEVSLLLWSFDWQMIQVRGKMGEDIGFLHIWNSHQFSYIETNRKKLREKNLKTNFNLVITIFSSGLEFAEIYTVR